MSGPTFTEKQFAELQARDPYFYNITKAHTQRFNEAAEYTNAEEIESFLSNFRTYNKWREFIGVSSNRVLILWGLSAALYVTHNGVNHMITIAGRGDGTYQANIRDTKMLVQMQIRTIQGKMNYYFIKNFELLHRKGDDERYVMMPYIVANDVQPSRTRLALISQQGYPASAEIWESPTLEKKYNDKIMRLLPAYTLDDPMVSAWSKQRKPMHRVDMSLLFSDAEARRENISGKTVGTMCCTCLATKICKCGVNCKCTVGCKSLGDFAVNMIIESKHNVDGKYTVHRRYASASDLDGYSEELGGGGIIRFHVDVGGLFKDIPEYCIVGKNELRVSGVRFTKEIQLGYLERLDGKGNSDVLNAPTVYIDSDDELVNPFEEIK